MKTYQKPEIEVVKFTTMENVTGMIDGTPSVGEPDVPMGDEE